MGFAWALDRVIEAMTADEVSKAIGEPASSILLVRPQDPAAFGAAIKEAERLRKSGSVIESEVSHRSLEESLQYAKERGVQRVVSVSAQGKVEEIDV